MRKFVLLTSILLASTAVPAFAQDTASSAPVAPDEDEPLETDIVVVAERIRGAVDTDVPPVEQLEEADIAALGASSVTDLLAAVAPQTGSGRGRGGGQPIVLLNGQRVSGFRELRDLPPEAIRQVQIFPEELALKYGFRPDQRVINFILKENFASFVTELEGQVPQDGGFSSNEVEATLTFIGSSSRLNLDAEYERSSSLLESERDIITSSGSVQSLGGNVTGLGLNGEISPEFSALVGSMVTQAAVPGSASPTLAQFAANAGTLNSGDIAQYRTLLPETERFEVNGTFSKSLGPQTNVSVNANYALNGSTSLLGLPGTSFVLPGSSPFSPFDTDVVVNRYFESPGALERETESHTFQTGTTFNTLLDGWNWTVTGNYDRIDSETRTTRSADFTALRTAVLAGTANPFAADFGDDLLFLAPDFSNSLSQELRARSTLGGSPFTLPAGEVNVTFSSGFTRQLLDSEAIRSGVTSSVSLRRNIINHNVNADLPLTDREVGIGRALGEIAINGNIGYSDVSDFGSLLEYGAGVRWSPFEDFTVQASVIGDENAPGIGQLGNPVLVTPNVSFYDFTRGESSFVNVITGGNPALVGEKRRDFKLGLTWTPDSIKGLGVQLEYFKNDSRNTTASFPLLTPEIEAAFADRVVRDVDGRIVSVDQRPVNFAREQSQRIRWGFNMSGNIGPEQPARGPGALGGGGGRPPGAGGGGRRGDGGGFGPGGGGMQSRWNVALYHTYRIQEAIVIRPGVPLLDLLDGSAISNNGGVSRHEVELSGGVFHKGLGFRLQGNYRSGTNVDGTGLPGSNDLSFSDLTSLDAFVFVNLDQRGKLTQKLPFLKGSRITLRVNNVLNDVIDVRDENGLVPLSYQPGYLDPRGRVFELSFRKRF
jgi:iron complex outermembrane recepter protein